MKIHTQPDQMGGVWANAAAVHHSPHEFTIDFLRCDFDDTGKANAGILVQRINMSPLFVTQLIGALQDNWSKYADKSMPKDLMDDLTIASPRLSDNDASDNDSIDTAGGGNAGNTDRPD
ncbi:MAG: DUF3467 domain-containing protein [Ilumatobacter sp.]